MYCSVPSLRKETRFTKHVFVWFAKQSCCITIHSPTQDIPEWPSNPKTLASNCFQKQVSDSYQAKCWYTISSWTVSYQFQPQKYRKKNKFHWNHFSIPSAFTCWCWTQRMGEWSIAMELSSRSPIPYVQHQQVSHCTSTSCAWICCLGAP